MRVLCGVVYVCAVWCKEVRHSDPEYTPLCMYVHHFVAVDLFPSSLRVLYLLDADVDATLLRWLHPCVAW
ncbi:hypothetical protein Pcinc_034246 [Petrolisthes cinctipes]|uniref:Uncharacterized protein n=1 Tax=Petrolisthes cinctipes TaxID=88211 RepID=A0AAE1EQP6_PETCI|nr:hypothetical protein Pcinc_034246 [Petrolisthes cinctipes]